MDSCCQYQAGGKDGPGAGGMGLKGVLMKPLPCPLLTDIDGLAQGHTIPCDGFRAALGEIYRP